MRAVWAVYKREIALFFRSPIAYAITFGMMLFLGILFSDTVGQIVQFNQSGFAQQTVPADDAIIGLLGTLTFLLFVIAPLLTMRLLSEETREGTLEVLMTLPMGDWAFVVGKFLAVWTVYTVILLLTLAHAFLISSVQSAQIDSGLLFVAYLGAWLYGGGVLAVSLIWSAVAEDQIVAAFLGAASVLMLFLADSAARQIASGAAAEFIRELSLQTHYQGTMLQGILRGEDVAYFIFLIIASLFITTLIVGTRRWRA